MRKGMVLAVVVLTLAGCGSDPLPEAVTPANTCIALTASHVPLGTSREEATGTLESLGLSCIYKKDNPTWVDGRSYLQDTLYTEVGEPGSVFSKSRYVPTLYLEDDVVVEILATSRRSMTPTSKPSGGDAI